MFFRIDIRSIENAMLACDLLCLLLELQDMSAVSVLWEFISEILDEAKEENLRQMQQIYEKLMDRFAEKGLFDQAEKAIHALESCIKHIRSTENLTLALCLRKRAALQLHRSKVITPPMLIRSLIGTQCSIEKAAGLAEEAYEMAWRLFCRKHSERDPSLSDRVQQLWKRVAKKEKRDEDLISIQIFNCLYELSLSALLLSQCLTPRHTHPSLSHFVYGDILYAYRIEDRQRETANPRNPAKIFGDLRHARHLRRHEAGARKRTGATPQ